MKILERRHWRRSGVFILNFEIFEMAKCCIKYIWLGPKCISETFMIILNKEINVIGKYCGGTCFARYAFSVKRRKSTIFLLKFISPCSLRMR